ncbi:MAG: hypothetical protein AAFQ98_16015 [Bacteroidota bacterium]
MLYFFTMVALLTLITQTGGIILIVAYALWKWFKWDIALLRLGSFFALYLLINLAVIPFIAPSFHRKPLPIINDVLRPQNWLTVLTNRHYVHEDMYAVLVEVGQQYQQQFPDRKLVYLDAGFPLGKSFPLPPHRAHFDGKAIDIAFAYRDQTTGLALRRSPNWLGYGRYEGPERGEPNWPHDCQEQGSWWYGIPHLFALRALEEVEVAEDPTRTQIHMFATHPKVTRIFLEPHLKQRWRLMGQNKVRFHGCKAMRHDDHFHLSIR